MKKVSILGHSMRVTLAKIHLADKFLIFFIVILMVQSAFSVFAHQTVTGAVNSIDIIFRTAIAGIFGYFLSNNFIRRAFSATTQTRRRTRSTHGLPEHRSVPHDRAEPEPSGDGKAAHPPETYEQGGEENRQMDVTSASRIQIITASSLGLFCLLVLILLRNVGALRADMTASASAAATVTQFRDMVSGCIGFLIGSPGSDGQQSK